MAARATPADQGPISRSSSSSSESSASKRSACDLSWNHLVGAAGGRRVSQCDRDIATKGGQPHR
jgi:hypothetical protein